MIPDLDMRNFWYSTGVSIFAYIAIIIVNLSLTKKKAAILGAPSRFIIEKLSPIAEKHKILKPLASKYFWSVVEIVFISLVQLLPQSFLNGSFGKAVGTGGNFFGFLYFGPWIMAVVFVLLWTSPLKNFDLFTFSVPVILFFNKLACFCAGCCNGVWWPGGVYNYQTQREEVPVQLIEAFCSLSIFIFLIIYSKKAKKRKDGDLFPLFTLLFSGLRFISEFWRGQKMVWLSFRYYHLFCAIGIVLGIIGLIVVYKYSDKINNYFDNTIYFKRINLPTKNKSNKKALKS